MFLDLKKGGKKGGKS